MVSEVNAKAGKPFTEGEFVKKCIIQFASKRKVSLAISANTIAMGISGLSSDIYDQL